MLFLFGSSLLLLTSSSQEHSVELWVKLLHLETLRQLEGIFEADGLLFSFGRLVCVESHRLRVLDVLQHLLKFLHLPQVDDSVNLVQHQKGTGSNFLEVVTLTSTEDVPQSTHSGNHEMWRVAQDSLLLVE